MIVSDKWKNSNLKHERSIKYKHSDNISQSWNKLLVQLSFLELRSCKRRNFKHPRSNYQYKIAESNWSFNHWTLIGSFNFNFKVFAKDFEWSRRTNRVSLSGGNCTSSYKYQFSFPNGRASVGDRFSIKRLRESKRPRSPKRNRCLHADIKYRKRVYTYGWKIAGMRVGRAEIRIGLWKEQTVSGLPSKQSPLSVSQRLGVIRHDWNPLNKLICRSPLRGNI